MNFAVKKLFRKGSLWLSLVLMLCLVGCQRGKAPTPSQAPPENSAKLVSFDSAVALISDDSGGEAATESATTDTSESIATTDATAVSNPTTTTDSAGATATTTSDVTTVQPAAIPEDGTYNSKDEVALYIHTYGKLPSNFITKKEAKKLGWTGGNVEDYAPGKSIGGDYFGNYEGLLPEDKSYHECDIDTLGKKSRGAKRIIYSDDGYIYYTGDHYESFELLYEP